jgi:hypothetical protein
VGRVEVKVAGSHLKPGLASIRIEVQCNDAGGDFPLVMSGKVGPPVHGVGEAMLPRVESAQLLLDR